MAAADWLHRKDGPSPRRPPPPPSPPPVPRVSKKDGPPSPERVSNDGDALRGALSEARAVAAAARVARTAAEDDAKRLRKERDDYRSNLEQAQRLLEVAKKAPRGDALQRRQQARHAEQLSKLGAAHAAANQALLEKHESTQREAKKHAENCQKLEDEKAAAIAAFDRLGESCGSAGEGGRATWKFGLRARARDRTGGAAHEARRGLDEIAGGLGRRRCGSVA